MHIWVPGGGHTRTRRASQRRRNSFRSYTYIQLAIHRYSSTRTYSVAYELGNADDPTFDPSNGMRHPRRRMVHGRGSTGPVICHIGLFMEFRCCLCLVVYLFQLRCARATCEVSEHLVRIVVVPFQLTQCGALGTAKFR